MYTYFKITKETTPEELKKQYRKLCFEYHPDREGGSAEAFKKVNFEYRTALKTMQQEAKEDGNPNLYKLINEQIFNIDRQIQNLNVPEQLKPAISFFAELGINNIAKRIKTKSN